MKETVSTFFHTQKGTYIIGFTDIENGRVSSFYVDLRVHPYYRGIETLPEVKDKLVKFTYGRNYPAPKTENR